MTEVTLTELRKNLFRLADQAVATGEPLRIRRRGRTLELRVVEETRPRTPQEWWAHYLSTAKESDAESSDWREWPTEADYEWDEEELALYK